MILICFTDLKQLNLSSNKIVTVENGSFDQDIHQDLGMVSLGNNLIKVIPVLDGFRMLKILNVSRNKLQRITLGKLDNLTELHVADSNFNAMPGLIYLLPSLQKLYVFKNLITSIPIDYFVKPPPIDNKNAFQLKAHLPLADRKSNTYNLTLECPRPWCDLDLIYDLDLRQVKPSYN